MGGSSKKKSSGGGGGGSSQQQNNNYQAQMQSQMQSQQAQMQSQMQSQQAQMQSQMQSQQAQQAQMQAEREAAQKAAEEEQARIAAQRAERERQQAIQAENQKAADFRRSSESNLKKKFQSMAENQRNLDQQSAQNASRPVTGGSGYNIATAQQQKIAAAGGTGGIAGPASTNAPGTGQMGVPQAMALNAGTGGTKQSSNFSLPTATGLQFGGM